MLFIILYNSNLYVLKQASWLYSLSIVTCLYTSWSTSMVWVYMFNITGLKETSYIVHNKQTDLMPTILYPPPLSLSLLRSEISQTLKYIHLIRRQSPNLFVDHKRKAIDTVSLLAVYQSTLYLWCLTSKRTCATVNLIDQLVTSLEVTMNHTIRFLLSKLFW